MNDIQIEHLINQLIWQKGITLWDMIGDHYVDPEQAINDSYGNQETSRWNKFKGESWAERFIELIAEGEYDPYADCHQLKIPIPDLIKFWWNRCIDRDCMLETIFEDIFCYFKDKLIPAKKSSQATRPATFPALNLDFEFKKAANQ